VGCRHITTRHDNCEPAVPPPALLMAS